MGTSPTRTQAPMIEGMEYWILNEMQRITQGFTRVFQMHEKGIIDHPTSPYGLEHIDELASLNVPVIMCEKHPRIPNSVAYPINEVINFFGRDLFQSSVDFMIALAIYEGYEEIYIYGVDMSAGEEYESQRPSMYYYLGQAEARGIKIIVPEASDLLKVYFRYGYESEPRNAFIQKAESKIAMLDKEMQNFNKNYYIAYGAKDSWKAILNAVQRG